MGRASKFISALLMSASFSSIASATEAAQAATETWDYQIFSFEKLNSAVPDPTANCKQNTLLAVLGHLGWELVQVFDEGVAQKSKIQGQIAFNPPNSKGFQQGTIVLDSQGGSSGTAIFKRRSPHAMKDKSCK